MYLFFFLKYAIKVMLTWIINLMIDMLYLFPSFYINLTSWLLDYSWFTRELLFWWMRFISILWDEYEFIKPFILQGYHQDVEKWIFYIEIYLLIFYFKCYNFILWVFCSLLDTQGSLLGWCMFIHEIGLAILLPNFIEPEDLVTMVFYLIFFLFLEAYFCDWIHIQQAFGFLKLVWNFPRRFFSGEFSNRSFIKIVITNLIVGVPEYIWGVYLDMKKRPILIVYFLLISYIAFGQF